MTDSSKPDRLLRAWIALVILSGVSALAAALVNAGIDPRITGTLVMLLALMKARVILSRYLGLDTAPSWRAGFNLTLTLFCIVLLGLYLIPFVGSK